MILRGVIKDPRVNTMLSITQVKVSKDLAYADIFVSTFEGGKKLDKAVEALNHAAGFIQHKLKDAIRLRNTPILRFKRDNAIARGYEMTKKLDELSE
jgi:ribosome-binding factor A